MVLLVVRSTTLEIVCVPLEFSVPPLKPNVPVPTGPLVTVALAVLGVESAARVSVPLIRVPPP